MAKVQRFFRRKGKCWRKLGEKRLIKYQQVPPNLNLWHFFAKNQTPNKRGGMIWWCFFLISYLVFGSIVQHEFTVLLVSGMFLRPKRVVLGGILCLLKALESMERCGQKFVSYCFLEN